MIIGDINMTGLSTLIDPVSYNQAIKDVIDTLKSIPAFQQMPDWIVPAHEHIDEYGIPQGFMVPEKRNPSKRLTNITDIIGEVEKLQKDDLDDHHLCFNTFQERGFEVIKECVGSEQTNDPKYRNDNFLEKSLELVQSLGYTESESHQMVRYVFGRPCGLPEQEVGGVLMTLISLCSTHNLDMIKCGETELARIESKIDKIRNKQSVKPIFNPITQIDPKSDVGLSIEDIKGWLRETSVYDGTDARALYYQRKRKFLTIALEALETSGKFGLIALNIGDETYV